jgi:predicted glycosyltransferase
MRVWIDLTNSPHVLVMRPVIERLRAGGHDVSVTARDYAQTLELCERLGIAHETIGSDRCSGRAGPAHRRRARAAVASTSPSATAPTT